MGYCDDSSHASAHGRDWRRRHRITDVGIVEHLIEADGVVITAGLWSREVTACIDGAAIIDLSAFGKILIQEPDEDSIYSRIAPTG